MSKRKRSIRNNKGWLTRYALSHGYTEQNLEPGLVEGDAVYAELALEDGLFVVTSIVTKRRTEETRIFEFTELNEARLKYREVQ